MLSIFIVMHMRAAALTVLRIATEDHAAGSIAGSPYRDAVLNAALIDHGGLVALTASIADACS